MQIAQEEKVDYDLGMLNAEHPMVHPSQKCSQQQGHGDKVHGWKLSNYPEVFGDKWYKMVHQQDVKKVKNSLELLEWLLSMGEKGFKDVWGAER